MKVAIIIPTLNEADNIVDLVKVLLSLKIDLRLLIVDDNSPDGTFRAVRESFGAADNVSIILRTDKRGRGSACIDGFKYFLERGERLDYMFEMDADFSHDPKDIPIFLKKMPGYDMIIGSRYLAASRIVNWSIKRRIFSKLANAYARILLGIPITDYTNGYRCYRFSVLEEIDFDLIEETGYIVLSEMAYQLFLQGYRIGEVPTLFVNRKRGISNLSYSEIWGAFSRITKLKLKAK